MKLHSLLESVPVIFGKTQDDTAFYLKVKSNNKVYDYRFFHESTRKKAEEEFHTMKLNLWFAKYDSFLGKKPKENKQRELDL